MAYLLPHLHSGWEVDQAIVTEEDRVVVIRFGRDQDATCMVQDEVLMSIADKVKNFAVIYLVRFFLEKFYVLSFLLLLACPSCFMSSQFYNIL